MIQLLSPGWWLEGFAAGFVWWVACVVAGLAVLPICLAVFRTLPDRGAGLSTGIGLLLANAVAWVWALEWLDGGGLRARGGLLAVACGLALGAWWALWRRTRLGLRPSRRHQALAWAPAVLLAAVALVRVPHGAGSFWLAVALLAAGSVVVARAESGMLRRGMRAVAVPWLVAQALFLVGFVFFLNVRSYIPYATWDASLSGAEKFGNLMHLNSAMRATTLPPADAWFAGEPTNYYYGGHLLVASVVKATGTESRLAFNFGVPTVFGLTLAMGFSLGLAMVRRTRGRVWRGLGVPGAMRWALLAAVAIAMFGNLDPWEQLLERTPADLHERVAARLEHAPPEARERLQAHLLERPGLLRLTPRNLATIDYWRSSRAVHGAPATSTEPGTITEFPYFSAILGDLHPHHMALPALLAALAAVLELLRRTQRPPRNGTEWTRRTCAPAAAMAVTIGIAATINIWDAVVLAVLYLVAFVLAARGTAFGPSWRWVGFIGALVTLLAVCAVAANAFEATVPVFGHPVFAIGGLVLFVVGLLMARWEGAATPFALGVPATATFVALALGGFESARGIAPTSSTLFQAAMGCRDGVLFFLCAGAAGLWAIRGGVGRRALAAGLAAYGLCGVAALALAGMLLTHFHSPLVKPEPLLLATVPPILHEDLFLWVDGFWRAFWERSPINPFPASLRTTLVDYLTHWGIFVVPVACLVLARVGGVARRWRDGRLFALVGGLVALVGFTLNLLEYWVGALALAAMACALLLAWSRRGERPLWAMLATVFFFHWFCEALHFDDEYEGIYERYNTLFKIWYPLWPMLALGMVVALEQGSSALRRRAAHRPWPQGLVRASVSLPVLVVLALGLLYPWAATATRTRHCFTDERALPAWARTADAPDAALHTTRTRDALDWMRHRALTAEDVEAIEWLAAHAPRDARLLEAPPDFEGEGRTHLASSYSGVGRYAATTGIPTPMGWAHHELQWRGWRTQVPAGTAARFSPHLTLAEQNLLETARLFFPEGPTLGDIRLLKNLAAAPPGQRPRLATLFFPDMEPRERELLVQALRQPGVGRVPTIDLVRVLIRQADTIYAAPEFSAEVRELLELHGVRYVVVGGLERLRYGGTPEGLAKFQAWEPVFRKGRTTIYAVPAFDAEVAP